MSGSLPGSATQRSYAAAIGVVAGAMALRFALNPLLGTSLQYSLQFIAVLVAARYFGFGPAVAGLALSSTQPVYRAISTGRDTGRYWIGFLLSWAFCIGLIWLLDRHRRMRSAVETSTRLAD